MDGRITIRTVIVEHGCCCSCIVVRHARSDDNRDRRCDENTAVTTTTVPTASTSAVSHFNTRCICSVVPYIYMAIDMNDTCIHTYTMYNQIRMVGKAKEFLLVAC
jgi:maleate cis-trans isomerase